MFRAVQAWKAPLRNQTVLVLSDNRSVCSYINRQGGTHSRSLCQLTVELLTFCNSVGISLLARHIPGRLNLIADSLSRQRVLHSEWMLHPAVFHSIHELFPYMTVDLFATRFNARLPSYVSPFPDNLALAVDGLAYDWTHHDLYAFPPAALVPLVLAKLDTVPCTMTLIAPLQWRRSWISHLLRHCVRPPLRLPWRPDLLLQSHSDSLHDRLETMSLHVFRLSGGSCPSEVTLPRSLTEYAPLVVHPR